MSTMEICPFELVITLPKDEGFRSIIIKMRSNKGVQKFDDDVHRPQRIEVLCGEGPIFNASFTNLVQFED